MANILGNLGIAAGAAADEMDRQRTLDRQDRYAAMAEKEHQVRNLSAAQQMALNGIKLKQAEAEQEDEKAIRTHIADTLDRVKKVRAGDFSVFDDYATAFNAQEGAFNDGHTVNVEKGKDGWTVSRLDPDGKPAGGFTINRDNAEQLLLTAAGQKMKYLAPKYFERSMKRAEEERTKELDHQNRKEIAQIVANSRMYGADARADALIYGADQRRESSQYSVDHRPAGRSGGLTQAQERDNAEIDAAREMIDGMDPAEIRRLTEKTTNTGRENPDYRPELERASRLAGRRKIGGDDDYFDSRSGKGAGGDPAQTRDRAAVAKEFRANPEMKGYTLGRETPKGIEVLDKGKVVGHFN